MDAAAMHALVDTQAAAIRRAWIAMVVELRAANPVERLLHASDLAGLFDAAGRLASAEQWAYLDAGRAAARAAHIPDQVQKKILDFDATAPEVMSWAERNKYDLIRNLSFEQRVMIRYALSVAQETGENPHVTAQRIFDDIGLTEHQAAAVESYRAALERGQYAAALRRELGDGRSERSIRAASAAERPMTAAQVDAAVARYRTNLLRLRATTIARTEAQRLTHQASDGLYTQALRRGDLQADQLEQEWIATRDPRTRDSHAEMHGQRQPWGTAFQSGDGVLLRYPGDPMAPPRETANCRCTRIVRILPRATRLAAAA